MDLSTPFHERDGVPSSVGHPLNSFTPSLHFVVSPHIHCVPAPFVVGQGPRCLDLLLIARLLVVLTSTNLLLEVCSPEIEGRVAARVGRRTAYDGWT